MLQSSIINQPQQVPVDDKAQDERNQDLLSFRISEENYDRNYDFIQKKILNPVRDQFKDVMQQIKAKQDETLEFQKVLESIQKETNDLIETAQDRLYFIEKKDILTETQTQIQKLVEAYTITKDQVNSFPEPLTDPGLIKVFTCLATLMENMKFDWKQIKEKIFCITSKKEYENIEFKRKLLTFNYDGLSDDKIKVLNDFMNDPQVLQSNAFQQNQLQIQILQLWCKNVLEGAKKIKQWSQQGRNNQNVDQKVIDYVQNDEDSKKYWKFQLDMQNQVANSLNDAKNVIQNNLLKYNDLLSMYQKQGNDDRNYSKAIFDIIQENESCFRVDKESILIPAQKQQENQY